MAQLLKKQIKRSTLRLFLGRNYYTLQRYFHWYFTNKKYAKVISPIPLKEIASKHQTPLLRKLQNVDMILQYNKITNLKLASKKINGIVLNPGETFSYWKLIGKPTYKKSYLDGLILSPDGTFKSGVGGGLCQLSNLIYWLTLHTPLTVIERYRHSHDIFPDTKRTQPFGSGATCSYNYLDLQIANCSNQPYQLMITLTEDHLVGEWRTAYPQTYSYEVYEKKHWYSDTFWGGYIRNNILHRYVYNSENVLVKDEYLTENHALMMYSPLLK